jgi:hypothetical protein
VDEWSLKPGAPDNHLLDVLVMAFVLSAKAGARLVGVTSNEPRKRQRLSSQDLRRLQDKRNA